LSILQTLTPVILVKTGSEWGAPKLCRAIKSGPAVLRREIRDEDGGAKRMAKINISFNSWNSGASRPETGEFSG
jgi:hypothetical protein